MTLTNIGGDICVAGCLSTVVPAFHLTSFDLRHTIRLSYARSLICKMRLYMTVNCQGKSLIENTHLCREIPFQSSGAIRCLCTLGHPGTGGIPGHIKKACAVSLLPETQAFLTAVEVRTFDLNIYTACELGQLFPLNKTFHQFKYPDGLPQPSYPH